MIIAIVAPGVSSDANNGVQGAKRLGIIILLDGPATNQTSLASGWTVAISFRVEVKRRAVDRTNFQLDLVGAVKFNLLFLRKSYATMGDV